MSVSWVKRKTAKILQIYCFRGGSGKKGIWLKSQLVWNLFLQDIICDEADVIGCNTDLIGLFFYYSTHLNVMTESWSYEERFRSNIWKEEEFGTLWGWGWRWGWRGGLMTVKLSWDNKDNQHLEGKGSRKSCVGRFFMFRLFGLRRSGTSHSVPPAPLPPIRLLMSWTWIIGVSLSRLRMFPSLSSYKNPHLCRLDPVLSRGEIRVGVCVCVVGGAIAQDWMWREEISRGRHRK